MQDSNFPWNLRVSFATDIAAGMVRSVWSSLNHSHISSIAKLAKDISHFISYFLIYLYSGISTFHEHNPQRPELIQLSGTGGMNLDDLYVTCCIPLFWNHHPYFVYEGQHSGGGRFWAVTIHVSGCAWRHVVPGYSVWSKETWSTEEIHCGGEPLLDGSRNDQWWFSRYSVVSCAKYVKQTQLTNFFPLIGKIYDERVDIFSFGIVLCEVRTSTAST